MDDHIQQLLKVGTLTGSRAFNCSHSKSDWDIVILQKNFPSIIYSVTSDINIISDTDFTSDNYVEIDDTFGIDVSEHEEFDEDVIEYDKVTIWGPLNRILKYYSPDSDEVINLFVYSDNKESVLTKFQEVTHLMNFIYGSSLADRPTRIEAFTKVLKSVGITDL